MRSAASGYRRPSGPAGKLLSVNTSFPVTKELSKVVTFLKRTMLSLDTSNLEWTASSEVMAKGTSSMASAAFPNALASAESASCRQKAALHRSSLTHPGWCTESDVALEPQNSKEERGHTLKNPMTATSLSAIRASASATPCRVVTAGPVRFFSQLMMSSACLPAGRR